MDMKKSEDSSGIEERLPSNPSGCSDSTELIRNSVGIYGENENVENQAAKLHEKVGDVDVKDLTVAVDDILDHVQNCSVVFKNQQMGEPELTISDKRSLALDLLIKNPSNFLTRFGLHLCEHHFKYFHFLGDPEVAEHAKQVKMTLDSDKKVQQRNRRYEALRRLEAEGTYFSEFEMEKREPLLYHQLVGQFLTEKEKIVKSRQNTSNIIPTFSNFLIEKMERDEVTALRKLQQETENNVDEDLSEDDSQVESTGENTIPRWGDDWIDAENAQEEKEKMQKVKRKKMKKIHLSLKEKTLLLEEFKSLMHSKFLNGLEPEFNYDDVDLNPDYDSLETKSRDAEDKYFDEESCSGNVCTDTGIEDY